jgi:hypothetical protein
MKDVKKGREAARVYSCPRGNNPSHHPYLKQLKAKVLSATKIELTVVQAEVVTDVAKSI